MPEQHKGLDYEAMQQMALQQQGHTHLLVIGVDAYAHCPPLSNCVKDAKDFTALMQQQYQVSPERTYELYDAQATRTQVLRQLKDLRHKVQEDDSLIVYFSGHGEIEDEEGYWIPIEGKPGEDEGWIAASSIKRRLNQVESFHTLVIADACFAGSFFVTFKSATRQLLHSRRSRWGISASHSRERALDGQAGDNSPFAKELLRALRHNQQPLPVDQLFTQLRDAVAAATQGRQTPIFKNIDVKGDDQGQFVFMPVGDEETAWAAAKATDTIFAYFNYNREYPNGKYRADALAAIRRLEEEAHWQRAQQADTLSAYFEFLNRFPDGAFAAQAKKRQEELLSGYGEPESPPKSKAKITKPPAPKPEYLKPNEEMVWEAAKAYDTTLSYDNYIKNYPSGKYRKEALNEKKRLEEEKEWQSTQQADTVAAYEKFLNRFPEGTFAKRAKQRKKELMIDFEKPKTPPKPGRKTTKSSASKPKPLKLDLPAELVELSEGMLHIPGGTFWMDWKGKKGIDREKHYNEVSLSDYYLGKYPVTQLQWEAIMGENPSKFKGCPNCPIENVSWESVQEFIKKLNVKTGENYRLPTEAEWEYAARGGEGGAQDNYLYSGSNSLDQVGWYNENSGRKTHPVGQKNPNQLGLFDMSGNVWEWVQDRWQKDYGGAPQDGRAWLEWNHKNRFRRVFRGGSWLNDSENCRVANRNWNSFSSRQYNVGFRLARDYLDRFPEGTFAKRAKQRKKELMIDFEKPKTPPKTERKTTKSSASKPKPLKLDLPAELVELSEGMLHIPGGTFWMGWKNELRDGKGYKEEKPCHIVNLPDYYLGRYPVTQALWEAVMGGNPSYFKNCPNCPVENVSWNDVQEFIEKLNAKIGGQYRLPSEAEWEYAARGGEGEAQNNNLYSGSNTLDQVGWYKDNSGKKTQPVGSKQLNQLGLYDMSGNVWEWCSDFYGKYTSHSQTNPKGPSSGLERVLRGGSWSSISRHCRPTNRNLWGVSCRDNNVGFRLARSS